MLAGIKVKKRDGRIELLDISKIQKYTSAACEGLQNVNQSELELDAKIQFRDGISTEEIQQTLIKTAVDKIDVDRPDWSFVASRLFLYDLYHKVSRWTGYTHLRDYFERGEKEGRIVLGLKEKYDLDDLNDYIKPERDLQFTYLGIKTLYDRYLLKDKNNNPIELPQHMFMAIAMFLAQNEENRQEWAKKFYDILSKFEVMAATPTLSNARTPRHQLSSCYVGSMNDNIEGIFDDYKEMALLSKFGGGIGWDVSKIRALGSFIDNHKNAAGGVIPWLRITNDIAIAVDQLGCVDRNSFVKVVDSVKTEDYEHKFFKRIKYALEEDKKTFDSLVEYAKKFSFDYGYFPAEQVGKIIENSIRKIPVEKTLKEFNISRNQYKKIMNRYKKIEKPLPEGFKRICDYPLYAINKNGVVINTITLKPLSKHINKKGYVAVTLNKTKTTLHTILYKTFIDYYDTSKYTIDHIDGDKLNNDLSNLQLLSNKDNISKGWEDEETRQRRIEKSKIKKYLTGTHRLNGDKRGWNTKIIEIKTKTIPITEVQVGDLIQSFNMEKGKVEFKEVEETHEVFVEHKNQIKIVYEDGGYIITSKWHPLAIYENEKFIYRRSDEVKVGDIGVDENGNRVKIVEIDNNPMVNENYFDLTIKDNNNYFCSTKSDSNVFHLIHNTRKGAIAVYLEPWHMDIMDFLELKKNSGEERRRAHDLFPALWINDLFMKRVEKDEFWTLFDPYEVPDLTDCYGEEFEKKYLEYEKDKKLVKHRVKAKELWKKVLLEYYETGNPFLCFKDNANRRNQNDHKGIIRSSNLCVTGDTRLATQFGLVKAKELEKMNKKIIASYDLRTNGDRKNYGVSTAECIEMYKTKENAKVYKITTKDGYEIKSTDWHEYYVVRDKSIIKIPLKEIKLSDKLLIQSAEGQFGKEGSYELGFLTGLIAGDGTFAVNKSKHQVACIDLYNEDIQMKNNILEYIKQVTKEEYQTLLHKTIKKDDEIKMPKEFKHTKNSKKIRFQSVKLGRILDEKYNFNKKTKLKVPEFVFQGKKECVIGYLQGIFTADATINKIKNDKIPTFAIQFATISEELAKDVQILLANFGIRSKISLNKKRDSFKYTTKKGEKKEYNSKPLYRLNINGRNATKFIKEIGFIGKKQAKALNILSEREKLGANVESKKSEYFETKIEKIEYIGKEDVYDTTQLVNHSLIFNGLVTGNCTEIYQNTEPNHYKVKITYEDGSIDYFEEDEIVEIDGGFKKPAKKLSSIDSINGKKIYIAEKTKIDGETAVCNLASVNLSKVNTPEKFREVIPIAVRMLDNVIDLNFYPQKKVKDTNKKNRAIGLGVMGEAQYLAENKIEWGSEEHLLKIDELMENFSYWVIKTSAELAQEKGIYPQFKGSRWEKGILPIDTANVEAKKLVQRDLFAPNCCDWDGLREEVKKGMRNGYLMAIAPTSSISILSGTTQAIEPVYKRKWFEENLSGLIPVVVPNLSPETWQFYIPAYELDQRILVKAAAIRQKWIDQGQSLNIFIDPRNASGRYLHEIYTLGWKLGVKSFYYLRSKSPEAEKDVMDRSVECMGCQ